MKYLDVVMENRKIGTMLKSPVYKVSIISNITIVPLKDILELSLRKEGINAEVTLGDYDSVVQDSIRFASFDAVIVIWEAVNFINGLHYCAENLTARERKDFRQKMEAEVRLVMANLRNTPLVIVNNFSAASSEKNFALDFGFLDQLCLGLNQTLKETAHPNQVIVDIEKILITLGISDAIDYRQFQQTKSLYTFGFFEIYAESIKPAFMSALGRAKKILVLDCDNTLWGGVIGEDGLEGIKLSDTDSKGSIFLEIQTLIKVMRKRGVILALCSKNNSHDVDNVIHKHPYMVIKDDEIVLKKVNWKDKAQNINEIAVELNIGLDSFVFIDDSPFEIELVKAALPQVTCYKVPENLSEYPNLIKKIMPHFYSLSSTLEDSTKTDMYKAESARKSEISSYETLEDYLVGLGLELEIAKGNNIPIERVAQLTQKTNQFNLTTKRYTEADIRNMLADDSYEIFCFNLSDRFGNYGVTGLAIISFYEVDNKLTALFDSFLMSCRVIGRTVEKQFFYEILKDLRNKSVYYLVSNYFATPKNSQVKNFYESIGFIVYSNKDGKKDYQIELNQVALEKVPYIRVIGD